ncbi:MAG TPA: response regulator, partial [Tepidisphaeraceae bacterium]|nr:response regulator [Tepidisphaeraceae bacterium]
MDSKSPIVFVIDDEPSICAATSRLLRAAHYQVRTFESTRQVFLYGRPLGPCCLILDLQIPGENG